MNIDDDRRGQLFEQLYLTNYQALEKHEHHEDSPRRRINRHTTNDTTTTNNIHRLTDWQRRDVAQRVARNNMYRILNRFESSNMFQRVNHYVQQWRTNRRNNNRQYINNNNNQNNYNAYGTYTPQESLIRSLVDRWIQFKNQFNNNTQSSNSIESTSDKSVARDFANRIDQYLFRERRHRQMIKQHNNNNNNNQSTHNRNRSPSFMDRLYNVWKSMAQLFIKIIRWILSLLG
jgi:hypothetical protein